MAVKQSAYSSYNFDLGATENKVYYIDAGAGAPTSGSYNAGDIALMVPVSGGTSPTVASVLGFRCTTGGSGNNAVWTPLGQPCFKGANVAAAATIAPTGSVFHVTGNNTNTISTITATGFQAGQSITMIPDGAWLTANNGNILLASTAVISKALTMTFDGNNWAPSY